MWKDKLILRDGETLKHLGSKTAGFMGETDIDTYAVVRLDGSEGGSVRVEDHMAVKGLRRTITVIQADASGNEIVHTSFSPSQQGKNTMATKAQQISINGHETNGELARRNLASHVAGLQVMRYMVTNALEPDDPALLAFDEGYAKLQASLAGIAERLAPA